MCDSCPKIENLVGDCIYAIPPPIERFVNVFLRMKIVCIRIFFFRMPPVGTLLKKSNSK